MHRYMNNEYVLHLHNVQFSAINNNKIMKFAGKWLGLEMNILNEVTQTQKSKYHMLCLICGC